MPLMERQPRISPAKTPEPALPATLAAAKLPFGRQLSGKSFWWTWLCLFLVVTALLFASLPGAICHANFFAEDGSVFFKAQYNQGFPSALMTHFAGYLHFAPRIVAAFCELFPVEYTPTAYAIVSLFTAAAVFAFFFAPGFRGVIASDWLRALVVIAFAMMPNAEALMKLAYINWYLVIFLALTTLFTLPKRPLALWLFFVPVALTTWTSPVAVVCVPVMLLRAWHAPRLERIWWLALALVAIGYPFTEQLPPTEIKTFTQDRDWLLALICGFGYRVLCFFFLSDTLCFPREGTGWRIVLAVASQLAVICVLGTVQAVRKSKTKWMPLAVLYLIVGTSATFLLRQDSWHFFQEWDVKSWDGNGRFFYCSMMLLCVLCGMIYELVLQPWVMAVSHRRKMAVFLLLVWLNLQAIGTRMFQWTAPVEWAETAREIRAAEARVRQTGGSETVQVRTAARGFDFDLTVNPANARRDGLF